MTDTTKDLPGFWRFVWLFFAQPITLHGRVSAIGIDPGESGSKLVRRPRPPEENLWLRRVAQTSLLILCATSLAFLLVPLLWRPPVNWADLGWLACLTGLSALGSCVSFWIGGVSLGVLAGVAIPAAFGVGYGAAWGDPRGTALVAAGGLAVGLTFMPAFGVGQGSRNSSLGASLGVSAAAGVAVALNRGGGEGMAIGIALALGCFRIPIYLLEALCQTAARIECTFTGRAHLSWAPVLYHNLSYFPHPFLRDQILNSAETDPALTRRVLHACSIAPGQRRIGIEAETTLRAREISRLAEVKDFLAIQELQGVWLPGLQGADSLLLGFSDAARYLVAAQASFGAHHRLNHLKNFTTKINALESQLRTDHNRLTQLFEEPLRALREVGNQLRVEAETAAAGLLPNPFRPGDALTSENGRELFRGRETAIRDIENALSDPTRSLSLQLLAPRRSGKTSLLKMLPDMLPDAVFVLFDLQANPANSLASFWKNLADKALIQAKMQRRIDLPPFPEGPPMEAANAWLEKLDNLPNSRRVLIAIDEFERLESLFPFSRQELLQLMGLLRATIQHRRNVRILVSGAAPFDELDRIWDDHFINTRQIKLPFLDQPTSVDLLMQPSADFPAETIPHHVALEVFEQTGGQPFLLQIFGYLLVEQLNADKRQIASRADIDAIQTPAIEWAEPYFRDMHKDAPPETREALTHLARGEAVNLTARTKRWLAQRYLLTPEDSLAIPLFASWIEHYAVV